MIRGVVAGALALAAVAACKNDEGERVPLGAEQPEGTSSSTLTPEARAALADGNDAYRAQRYPDALTAYRRAAAQSPDDVAPLWGIQMAARALGDSALVDSVTARMRELAPASAPVAGQDPHAGAVGAPALPPDHPPVNANGGAVVPPAHPSTTAPSKAPTLQKSY